MKVLLAEDSALLRAGLCQLLRAMGHHVVEVGDADTLLQAGRFSDIEAIVTDVRMPPRMADDGLAVVHELRRERLAEGRPVLPVIVLSQYVAAAYLDRLLDYGAFGYLLKERVSDVAEFSRALVDVVAGGTVVDPEVTRALVGAASDGLAMLTDRERDVLELMAQGLSNSQIGERLFLSRSGVSKHVANVFIELGFDPTDDNRRVRAVLVWLRREGYSPGSFEAAGTSITHIVRSGEAERVATAGRVRSVKMLGPGLGSRISAWTLVGATIEIALIWHDSPMFPWSSALRVPMEKTLCELAENYRIGNT